MNQHIKNSIATFGNLIPFSMLSNGKQFPLFLPFYHIVSDSKPEYINSYRVRSTAQFERELDYLLQKYKPVSLKEILENPAPNKMHLTFDDGLKECATVISPILKQKGVPATFFVSPDFIDNKEIFHRFKRSILESNGILEKGMKKYSIHEVSELDQLALKHNINFSNYKPYMAFNEVKSLYEDGFTIGAHSLNHPEMYLLNEEEQYRQIAQSMQWVVDNFNPDIRAFSFPFTDDGIKLSLFERLKKDAIVDVTFGTAGLKYDSAKNHYQRIPVELAQNWSIKKVLHYEYFYFKIRNLFSANIVKRI